MREIRRRTHSLPARLLPPNIRVSISEDKAENGLEKVHLLFALHTIAMDTGLQNSREPGLPLDKF